MTRRWTLAGKVRKDTKSLLEFLTIHGIKPVDTFTSTLHGGSDSVWVVSTDKGILFTLSNECTHYVLRYQDMRSLYERGYVKGASISKVLQAHTELR